MTSARSRLAGLVAVALVAAAGLVGLSSGPAAAALCSGAGVNVMVDFNGGRSGGVQTGCDPRGAGRSGDEVFPAAGFSLTYAKRQPGFVCRVNGSPSDDPCMNTAPADAYWGLYWSNGKSRKWTYSSSGVGGTSVPTGGFLAFSWHDGAGNDEPSSSPIRSRPAPATKAPTKKATNAPAKKQAANQSSSGSGSTSAESPEQAMPDQPSKTQGAAGSSPQKKKQKAAKAKRASASKQAKAKAKAKAKAFASARSSASESAAADSSDGASPDLSSAEKANSAFASDEQNGLPVWVPVLVVLALAGAAGGTAWWRRRTGAP